MPGTERLSRRKWLAMMNDRLGRVNDMFGDVYQVLGRELRGLRHSMDNTLADWEQKTGIKGSVWSRIEHNQGPHLSRRELIVMGMLVDRRDEMDDILIKTGHLPQLSPGLEKFLEDPSNLRIFTRAYREMTGERSREGYIEIIQNAAKSEPTKS